MAQMHDTMDIQDLQNIIVEYGKIKSIKVINHQNGGTENSNHKL